MQLGHSRVPVTLVQVCLGGGSQHLYPCFYLWLVLFCSLDFYSGMADSVHSDSWSIFVSVSHSVAIFLIVPVADRYEVFVVGGVWTGISSGLVDSRSLLLVRGFYHFS